MKTFGTQGRVYPSRHYVVPRTEEKAEFIKRVKEGRYIVLFAPRQTGKTTFFRLALDTRSELGKTVVGSPLILLVEAKKNDFEQGWGQCLAELVAAQKINDDAGFPVYGIVTDGTLWQFGRLIGDTFTQNRTDFALANLPTLFGAVDSVFKATANLEPMCQDG